MTALYWRKSADPLLENGDKKRVKLDCWARKVRIKTPLIAPLAQVLSLFSRENGTAVAMKLYK
jgi:stringent starvation protein B